ncbi:MAG: hybrid sensor histidine kinase/response regulator [Planctomycetota bacterium]|nr:hybrid sensor histidine kinase/response regulator [Planctomycetota bacterium]MDA1249115.1 hybrid sensor histidine kinase/response regulator [Planctomycetota bacterium]
MVDRAGLLKRLMATFLDELDEHVQKMSHCVLALEKEPSGKEREEYIAELFRAAHSLKGAARAVDQPQIERLCHVLEDAFGAIRAGTFETSPELSTLLLKTADVIGGTGQTLRAHEPVDEKLLGQYQEAVRSAVAGEPFSLPVATSPEAVTPEAAKPDVPEPKAAAPEVGAASKKETVAKVEADSRIPSSKVTLTETASKVVTGSEKISSGPASDGRPTAKQHASSTVRVSQEKLDQLLAQTGELLVVRQRIDTHPNELEALLESVAHWKQDWQSVQRAMIRLAENGGADPLLARSGTLTAHMVRTLEANGERLRMLERSLEQLRRRMQTDARRLNVVGAAVQDEVHDIRMVPFVEACAGLERLVRDIATTTGKNVELFIEGGDIEVDRSVLSGLADPLMHLVRNAVDHGIEAPDDRQSAGKTSEARLTVSASLRGSQIQVVVSDDGRGLNLEKIRDRVRTRGLPEPADDHEVVNCIFLPGFSTAEIITDVSGRGVGMDVVKRQVETLRGTIETATQPGLGTRFTLLVPLTLTTINAVFVRVGEQTFLLPSSNVSKLVRFLPTDVRMMQGQETLPLEGAPLPVVSLGQLLGRDSTVTKSESGHLTGVIGCVGEREAVFVVDHVSSEREIVIKNLGPRIHRVPHVSGATLLQSGEIALLLNVPSLMRSLTGGVRESSISAVDETVVVRHAAQRVLVVDDSITTRTLIRSILETAGYEVEAAVDGRDAWDRMQASAEGYELIVSDVDMPRMNGFRLTEAIRSSDRHQDIPVVLVTSRDSDEDKAQGVRAGASAYLVKSQFDQTNILETIQQLI